MTNVLVRRGARRPPAVRPRLTLDGLEDRSLPAAVLSAAAVAAAPAAPTGVTATAFNSSQPPLVVVRWDPVAGADAYRVEVSRGGAPFALIPLGVNVTATSAVYLPEAGGPHVFRVRAVAGGVASDPSAAATANVIFFPVAANTIPHAAPDYATTAAGASVLIPVTANDFDLEGNPFSLVRANTNSANGTVAVENGQVRYTPRPGFTGLDTFSYTISDAPNRFATTSVTVAVAPPAGLPVVRVEATDALASEPGGPHGTGTFRVTRSGDLSRPLTVQLIFGASAGRSDFQNQSTSVTIPAGRASTDVVIRPVADQYVEGTEVIGAAIQVGAGYGIEPGRNAAAVRLTDATNLNVPTVRVTATDPTGGEPGRPGGKGVFTVTRDSRLHESLTVHVTLGGTATVGADYRSVPLAVTFAPGELSKTVTIDPLADALTDPNETVVLSLAPGGDGYFPGTAYDRDPAKTTATVTILM